MAAKKRQMTEEEWLAAQAVALSLESGAPETFCRAGEEAALAQAMHSYSSDNNISCYQPIDLAREEDEQCCVFRDIVGPLPFRDINISHDCLAWRDETPAKLARSAYELRSLPSGELDNGRLSVLADALEEADVTNEEVLQHLRSTGPHYRGCWALDLCLGKT